MTHLVNNTQIWDTLYKNGAQMSHPDDSFIRMSYYLLKDNVNKVLDYGFGSGVTTMHLAQRNFNVTGLEVSQEAIKLTHQRLAAINASAQLDLYDGTPQLTYSDNSFDAIIAWQSLTYNTPDSFEKIMAEFYRVLKPGGVFLAAISAPGDHIHATSTPLENGARQLEAAGQEGATVFIPTEEQLHSLSPTNHLKLGKITLDYQAINNIICKYHLVHYTK